MNDKKIQNLCISLLVFVLIGLAVQFSISFASYKKLSEENEKLLSKLSKEKNGSLISIEIKEEQDRKKYEGILKSDYFEYYNYRNKINKFLLLLKQNMKEEDFAKIKEKSMHIGYSVGNTDVTNKDFAFISGIDTRLIEYIGFNSLLCSLGLYTKEDMSTKIVYMNVPHEYIEYEPLYINSWPSISNIYKFKDLKNNQKVILKFKDIIKDKFGYDEIIRAVKPPSELETENDN